MIECRAGTWGTYSVSVDGDPGWARGQTEVMAAKLARVAACMGRQVEVRRERDGALVVPHVTHVTPGGNLILLTPAEQRHLGT